MNRLNAGKCEITATPLKTIKRYAKASEKIPVEEIIRGSEIKKYCQECGASNGLSRYKNNNFIGCYCERCFLGKEI